MDDEEYAFGGAHRTDIWAEEMWENLHDAMGFLCIRVGSKVYERICDDFTLALTNLDEDKLYHIIDNMDEYL